MSGGRVRDIVPGETANNGIEKLCKAVAAQMEGYAFWYEPGRGSRCLPGALLELLGLEAENGVCAQVWAGAALDGRNGRSLKEFFLGIGPDRPAGRLIFKTGSRRKGLWLEARYTWIEDGAVVSVKDVTEARDRYLVSQDCFRQLDTATWEGLFRCVADLTEDRVVSWISRVSEPLGRLPKGSYSRMLEEACRRYVDLGDRETIRTALSADGLLALETCGEVSAEYRVRCVDVGGLPQGLKLRVNLVREPYGGNLCARLYASAERDSRGALDWRDGLTGVYSRSAFLVQLTERLNSPEAGGTLALLRISHLDRVNDLLGPEHGDRVLVDMARTITAMLHEEDLLGRYGGAEFFLYLAQPLRRELLEERLQIMCRALTRKLDKDVTVSVNLGAVELAEPIPRGPQLHEQLRLALRAARRLGEGRFAFYHPELQAEYQPEPPVPAGKREPKSQRVFVRTFGYFDVFVDGVPIHFHGGQAKELMALLVDRRGGILSSAEAIACLWEDEPANKTTYARLRKVALRLKQSLEEAGVGDILESEKGERRIIPEKFRCDYYEYLESGGRAAQAPPSAYMTNYSWAESTLANL